MPFGGYLKYYSDDGSKLKRLLRNLYLSIYGTPDLHSHIRWRAIKSYIQLDGVKRVLDIGCGSGAYAFQLASNNEAVEVVGIDTDKAAIEVANFIKERVKANNVSFYQLDATMSYPYSDNYFDLVLLIDVLEHVQDDKSVIAESSRVLKPKGHMIISVPTPNYPVFFGRDFHEEIGHLRDGYWLEDLVKILRDYDLDIISYQYYTYLPSCILCALFYRYLRKVRYIRTLVSPVFNILSFFDAIWPMRSKKFACSLVVKAQKGG